MVEILPSLRNATKIAICGGSLVHIFLTIINLTYFLSVPRVLKVKGGTAGISEKDKWVEASWALAVDMLLLSVFVLQHSLLASKGVALKIKIWLRKWGLETVYRSIYIATTACALQVLLNNWLETPQVILWQFNLNYRPIWWLYLGIHITAWLIIYIGNICMDITELLGIKQVRYSFTRYPKDPNYMKSEDLLRLYSHMRHPSFLAFTLIFWFAPCMSLDRFLLATILTFYMGLTWNTDDRDYAYQKHQYVRKYHELERLSR